MADIDPQIAAILQAIKTTADTQAQAISDLTKQLTGLAAKLEPLAPQMEKLIADFSGQIQRQETVTLALVRLYQQERAKEKQEEQEHHLV